MMTTNLTKPISKKLLIGMLVVVFGAEILLYLNRFSYLAGTLYDAVMVASLFIGIKLHRRLTPQQEQGPCKTKRQKVLQFTGAFLIFFLGSTVINIYSSMTFDDFNSDYDQYVQTYTDTQTYQEEEKGTTETTESKFWSYMDKIDTIGADLYTDALAGLEEIWRLAYMIIILAVFKKLFPKRWESGSRDVFLMVALFWTSLFFGIDHTLDTEQAWTVKIGSIVTFANMGFLFGIILLWTRNLWLTVLVHSLYDITATLSWYYIDYAVELFAGGLMVVHMILFLLEKLAQKRVHNTQLDQTEAAQIIE
ncbi:CPBP family intramembrane glutamic endopeptidase [Neobacillus citreus]|uniref:CPBP family intramembrane metalloprotease n=1 Tax=Neobacillus citreus TaxID=2833578 RepID=A0A942YBC2_9BACI|nr:CPBP family intramembrane glutamic endopeptidase [Neobacillus citreus]MCH6269265.1 CPBP family intramembrane metalloprotease [Neobacillus citreus]